VWFEALERTEGILERVEPKEGTFEASWADRDTEERIHVCCIEIGDVTQAHPDELFGEERHPRLAERTAFAVPFEIGNPIILNEQIDLQIIATARILFVVTHRWLCETARMTRVLAVIEDVFGVEIHCRG
jgi:hypothetical protein